MLLQFQSENANNRTKELLSGISGILKEASPFLGMFLGKGNPMALAGASESMEGIEEEEEEERTPVQKRWETFYEKWSPHTNSVEDVELLDKLLTQTVKNVSQKQNQTTQQGGVNPTN